jgi:hypothetical protein
MGTRGRFLGWVSDSGTFYFEGVKITAIKETPAMLSAGDLKIKSVKGGT